MASFDIVCQVDFQEVTNAVDQARREIANRYDFKGSNCTIELDSQKGELLITADDEYKMQTVIDILLTRLLKRSVPVKSLVYGKTTPSGKVLKKNIDIQQGLSKDQCKEVNLCYGSPLQNLREEDCLEDTQERAWSSPIFVDYKEDL